MRIAPAIAMIIIAVTVTFSFITPANTNSLFRESEIIYGPINPSAGQYAEGMSQKLNTTNMSILDEGWLNFTFIGYVDEYLFNVKQSVQSGIKTYEYWLTVNVTDRSVIDGTSWWVGTYYFGWIPTNIEIGVTVALGLGNSTVQAKEVITVEDTEYETWMLFSGELSGSNTTSWYDVHSGHLVKTIQRGVSFVSQWFLISSNIVTPHEADEPVPSETTPSEMITQPEITTTSSETTIGETVTEPRTMTESEAPSQVETTSPFETTTSLSETTTTLSEMNTMLEIEGVMPTLMIIVALAAFRVWRKRC